MLSGLAKNIVFVYVLSASLGAWGQRTTVTLAGAVTDTTGAMLPGATVTLIGQKYASQDEPGVKRDR